MSAGIIRNEPIASYHANEAISSTQLLDMRPTPRFFFEKHVAKTLPRESKREFDLGNSAHWLILEGRQEFEERIAMVPEVYQGKEGIKPWNWNANACKDWRDARPGKVLLSGADLVTIDRMAAAVEENPDAVALLSGGESEVTFRVQHPAFAVQCRADHWHEVSGTAPHRDGWRYDAPVCVDLKTCESIEQFRAHYFQHRYYYRAAFYRDVIAGAIGTAELPAFVFVAVEKNAPFRCEVFEPTEGDIELGRIEVLADLMTLRRCIERNEWPNSKPGVQPIELTEWQRRVSQGNGAALFETEAA